MGDLAVCRAVAQNESSFWRNLARTKTVLGIHVMIRLATRVRSHSQVLTFFQTWSGYLHFIHYAGVGFSCFLCQWLVRMNLRFPVCLVPLAGIHAFDPTGVLLPEAFLEMSAFILVKRFVFTAS